MQDYFFWNGVDCRTYGIHVTEQPPITIRWSGAPKPMCPAVLEA